MPQINSKNQFVTFIKQKNIFELTFGKYIFIQLNKVKSFKKYESKFRRKYQVNYAIFPQKCSFYH